MKLEMSLTIVDPIATYAPHRGYRSPYAGSRSRFIRCMRIREARGMMDSFSSASRAVFTRPRIKPARARSPSDAADESNRRMKVAYCTNPIYLSAMLHGFAGIIVADRIGRAGRAKSRARGGNTISASSVTRRGTENICRRRWRLAS